MDRFIDLKAVTILYLVLYLKSNMDRFIAVTAYIIVSLLIFKIQYG